MSLYIMSFSLREREVGSIVLLFAPKSEVQHPVKAGILLGEQATQQSGTLHIGNGLSQQHNMNSRTQRNHPREICLDGSKSAILFSFCPYTSTIY